MSRTASQIAAGGRQGLAQELPRTDEFEPPEAVIQPVGFGPIHVEALERVRRGHPGLAAGGSRFTV